MKPINKILLGMLILANTLFLSGCWNYREIDMLAVVAGIAIDKSVTGDQYLLTVETVDITGGREAIKRSNTITAAGDTLLDAEKNIASISGKRLYFAHARAAVLSRESAEEGAVKVIDWLARNVELREDIEVLVSQEPTAKEILETGSKTDQIASFELEKVLKNEKNIAGAPQKELWKLINEFGRSGISAVVPAVSLKEVNGRTLPSVLGTAVFKGDRLAGFLDDDDTKGMLFIQNKIQGGVLVQNGDNKNYGTKVSLKIINNTTRLKPVAKDGKVEISIDIKTTAAIDEIEGTENYIDEPGRLMLEKKAEENLKISIENLVKEVQTRYNSDIFGFGAKIKADLPGVWKETGPRWEQKFKDVKVSVHPEIIIKNSAAFSQPLKIGD